MSEQPSASASGNTAGAGSAASTSDGAAGGQSAAAPKRPAIEGNPAFRMMGLPRLRLPSRNWLIFLSITGGFASAVVYDKYQTRRMREKWCHLVSHISKENIPPDTMPRKMTIYLAAPPGDGLRIAREHFHNYVKPVLVAAAMDWDVIEGRKEGDVRYKTAERVRKRRRRAGENPPLSQEELESSFPVETVREQHGTKEWDGIAGDLVIGRNTWKEYIRGLHEGWLGPTMAPADPAEEVPPEQEIEASKSLPGQPSLGDAAVKAAVNSVVPAATDGANSTEPLPLETPSDEQSPTAQDTPEENGESEKKEEEEKPKPRQPPPYIQPSDYSSATPSKLIPELIGPSIGIQFPHILGFRNTPIRIYRFLNRRHLADSIGKDVAAAVLASYRPYSTVESDNTGGVDGVREVSEQENVLKHEERNWWKTTFQPRKEHEESVWIEDMVLDERIASRMRAFQLTAEDEDRAKRIYDGKENIEKSSDDNES